MRSIVAVRSKCLEECGAAFCADLWRTGSFQMLPVEIAFQVRRDTIWQCNAANAVSGRSQVHIMDVVNQEITPAFMAAFNAQVEELERAKKSVQNWLRVKLGVEYVEKMLEINEEMRKSVDLIFTAIVRESWTAFECFAADVWNAGVDNGPSRVKSHPGRKRKSFQGLEPIKRAYGAAFGDNAEKLFDTVASGDIVLLAGFRNVMTHSPGKATKYFVGLVRGLPEFKSIKEGDPVLLNGELVRRLRIAGALLGDALIHFVDDTITPPPGGVT